MTDAQYGPDRAAQAEQRLADLLRGKPIRRKRNNRCRATARPARDDGRGGGTFLCWLPEGHDGWHVNPHLRDGQRPGGWFVNRAAAGVQPEGSGNERA